MNASEKYLEKLRKLMRIGECRDVNETRDSKTFLGIENCFSRRQEFTAVQ